MLKKKLFAIGLSIVFAFSMGVGLSGCDSDTSETDAAADEQAEYSFDPAQPPSNIKGVVYLKGTPNEMGKQYGQQAKESLERMVVYKKSLAAQQFESLDEAYEQLPKYEAIYEENVPDVVEMWKGMAETSGIDYNDILLTYTQFYISPHRSCSTVSVWGDQTKNGKLISATNYDLTLEPYTYEPSVIAYPKDGNAFIAGTGLIGGSYMNDKGLIVMGSQGQDNNDEDLGMAVAPKVGLLQIIMSCNTAKEAVDMYIGGCAPGSGENLHVDDLDGGHYIVEHTMAKNEVREEGDFGEKDYMIATNGFLQEKMWDSLYQGDEFWDDDLPRYWTEEKIITDNEGKNTIDTINEAIGSTRYYVDKNWATDVWEKGEFVGYKEVNDGEWVDAWDLTDAYTGFWSPENKEPGTKTIASTVAIPEDMTMYVMQGCRDTYVSDIPDATGNFSKLTLSKSPAATTAEAQQRAQIYAWLGERDTEESGITEGQRIDDLNTAKEALYEGMTYKHMAGAESDTAKRLEYFGLSTTAFQKAMCYAQLAMDNPTKLKREGEDYTIY